VARRLLTFSRWGLEGPVWYNAAGTLHFEPGGVIFWPTKKAKRPPANGGLFAFAHLGPHLALKSWSLDGYLQVGSPLVPFFFGKLSLAFLESREFLLRRLKKAVAWCYRQLSVSRHLRTPLIAQPDPTQVPEHGKGSVL
jgi:hypothetical protein